MSDLQSAQKERETQEGVEVAMKPNNIQLSAYFTEHND